MSEEIKRTAAPSAAVFRTSAWISAFDGTSGAELWRSGLLGKDAEDGYALRGIAHGRFVAVDAVGPAPALMVVAAKVGTTRLLDNEWIAAPEGLA